MQLEVEGVSSWADLGLKFRVSVVAGVVGHRFLRPFRSEVTRCCIPCYRILHPRSKQDLGKRDAGMQSTPNRQTPHSRDCVENRSFFGTRNLPRLGSADLIRNPAVKSPRQGQRVVAASASLNGGYLQRLKIPMNKRGFWQYAMVPAAVNEKPCGSASLRSSYAPTTLSPPRNTDYYFA